MLRQMSPRTWCRRFAAIVSRPVTFLAFIRAFDLMALFYHTSAFSQIIFDAGGCPDRRVRQPILFQEKTALRPAWQFPRQAAFHIFTGNAVLSKIEQPPCPRCVRKNPLPLCILPIFKQHLRILPRPFRRGSLTRPINRGQFIETMNIV